MTSNDPRDHLVLVLDVERLDDALAYAERMAPWFSIVKVGYELYGSAGPEAFEALRHKGFRVFADLKLHDIPTTVERSAFQIARLGVPMFNVHALGGSAMMRAALEGAQAGADAAGVDAPLVIAVTVLSSQSGEDLASPASLGAGSGTTGAA